MRTHMNIAEGNSKRRRICDSAQDIGDYTGYKAFQIEEGDGLNILIARICNKTNTDNKEASSLEAAALTPRPTGQGRKRLTHEDDSGKKTVTDETPCWSWKPEPDGKLGEDEAISRSRFRQALKKQLKKRASLIEKTMRRRISKVTKKMKQLEQENKELREYAPRLFATLQDVIQRQKQKTHQMVSFGTQVNMSSENDQIISRGTQVNMRVVLKPVMPSNSGTVQRFHNLVYLYQDGSADHMEYIPTCRGASAKRAYYDHLHSLDVTSNLLSSRGSIPHHHHHHPGESDLVDVSCSCLPDEGRELQRNTAQIHEMNMFSRDQSHRRSDRCKNFVKSQAPITPFREKYSSFTSRQPRQMQQESYLSRKSRNQLRKSFKRVTSGESKVTNTSCFQMSRSGNGLQTKPRTEHGHRNQFLPRKSQLLNPSSIFGIGQEQIGLFAENKQEKCQLTNKFPLNGVNVTKQSQLSETRQNLHDRISLPETQLTITLPNPLLEQEMTSCHGGTADLHTSSRYSPSSSLGRSVRSQNGISTSSNEPVENFPLPHELTSRKIRTLITNQILSESVEQGNSCSSIPPQLTPRRGRNPLKIFRAEVNPNTTVDVSAVHSYSEANLPRKGLHQTDWFENLTFGDLKPPVEVI